MNSPRISIVMPVFNAERELPTLLASIFAQSEADFELIAIDDGSDDGSGELLRRSAADDPRVRLIEQPNSGLSAARNRGLRAALGRWIAFADADDWLDPRALENWVNHAESAALDVVIGNGFRFVDFPAAPPTRIPLLQQQPWGRVVSGAEWIRLAVDEREWLHFVWLQLVRADLIRDNRFEFVEGIVHEDVLWTLQVALASRRVGFVREPLYGYRSNPASITNTLSPDGVLRRLDSYLIVIRSLSEVASAMVDSNLRRALFRHANRETLHFVNLLRRKVHDVHARASFARQFLADGLDKALFRGVVDRSDLWRAVRCWLRIRWYGRGPKSAEKPSLQ